MKHPKLIKIIATVGMIILVMLIIAVGLKLVFPTLWDALKAGDEKGLEEFLKAAKGPKMLVFLFILQFVQIISIMLPSPPIHIAGGMVAGTLRAFTTCIISYTLANLFVFVCARKFHGKLNALESKENSKSSKLTEMLANSDLMCWEHHGMCSDFTYRNNAGERVMVMKFTRSVPSGGLIETFEHDVDSPDKIIGILKKEVLPKLWF